MATRFYLPSTGTPSETPAYSSYWDTTTSATRLELVTTKINSALVYATLPDDDNATDLDVLRLQYISAPLAAQTISAQTVKLVIASMEASGGNNLYLSMVIRSWNGASFQTLYSGRDDNEVSSTAYYNRSFSANTSGVTVSDGDVLVVEIGFGGDPVPSGAHDGGFIIQDDETSDLPDGDDTYTGTTYNPWIEFPNTLSFQTITHEIDVSDGITVGEDDNVIVQSPGFEVNVSDGITLGESISSVGSDVKIAIRWAKWWGYGAWHPLVPYPSEDSIKIGELLLGYQPHWGAGTTFARSDSESYANSKINVVNPGTYDATDIVAFAYDSAIGWYGIERYVDTGYVPSGILGTYLAEYADSPTDSGYRTLLGARDDPITGAKDLWIFNTNDSANVEWRHGGTLGGSAATADGNLAMAGASAYKNGIYYGTIGSGSGSNPFLSVYVGLCHGVSDFHADCEISTVAFFTSTLTANQVKNLEWGMGVISGRYESPPLPEDTITIGESANVSLAFNINVSDNITVGESTNLEEIYETLRIDAKPSGDINIDLIYGDFSQFTSVVDGGGTISSSAALGDTNYGLEANADYGSTQYGLYTLDTPSTTGVLRARIYVDPNTISLPSALNSILLVTFASSTPDTVASMEIANLSGTARFRATIFGDTGDTFLWGPAFTPGEGYCFEIELTRATSDVAGDGSLYLWINGTQYGPYTRDNYDTFINLNQLKVGRVVRSTGVTGTVYVDELVVNFDGSEIGTNKENVDIGESVTVVLGAAADLDIDEQDDLIIGESLTISISDIEIDETDGVTVGEDKTVTVSTIEDCDIDVQDDLVIGESLSITLSDAEIDETDGVVLGESITVTVSGLDIDEADGLTVGENVSIEVSDLEVDETDNLIIGEDPTVNILSAEDYNINVFDDLVIGESSIVKTSDLQVDKSEDLTIGENVSLELSDIEISETDNLIIGDSPNVNLESPEDLTISEQDDLIIGESTTLEISIEIDISDGLTLGESSSIFVSDLEITEVNNLIVGDDANISIPEVGAFVISEQDDITLGESINLEIGISLDVTDGLAVGESLAITVSDSNITETDSLAVGEDVNVSLEAASDINVQEQDDLAIGEFTDVTLELPTPLDVDVSDGVALGEAVEIYTTLYGITVTDNVNIGESLDNEVTTPIVSVVDNITVADIPQVALLSAGDIAANSLDDVIVGESVSITVSDLFITESDGLIIGEDTNVTCSEVVEDLSIAITPETVWAIGVRIYP